MSTRAAAASGRSRPQLRVRELLFLLAASVLFLLVFARASSSQRFVYDEADYMAAARMGFRENYVETSSMSLPAFVKTGLAALSGKIDRVDLSEYVRHRNDVSFYRHYHGPLYFHWLTLIARVSDREAWMRAAGLCFHLLTFVTIFVGIGWLLGPEGRPASWIASLAYLFSITNIRASLVVNTHQMYAWLAVLTLFLIARFLTTGSSAHLLAAVAGVSLAVCTVAYAILLGVTLAVCAFLRRRRLVALNPALASRAVWLKGLGLFAGLTLVLWPAGVLKLSMLKSYLMIPYVAVARKDSFGMASLGQLWSKRLSDSPVEYLVLLACLGAGIYALTRHRSWPQLVPFVLYAGFILVITAKSDIDRYLASALPALYVVGGVVGAALITKAGVPRRRKVGAAVAGIALLLLNVTQAIATGVPAAGASADDTVAFVARQRDRLHAVLVPAACVPTLHYYVPEVIVRSYLPERGPEHVLTRLAVAPVDALFVDIGANDRLRLDLDGRLGGRSVVGPEGPRPECGQFVVYFFDGAGESRSRHTATQATEALRP